MLARGAQPCPGILVTKCILPVSPHPPRSSALKSCNNFLIPAVHEDFTVHHKFTKYLLSVLCQA